MGDYQKALSDFSQAKSLGASDVDMWITDCRMVACQFSDKGDLPPATWEPSYETYAENYETETKNVYLHSQVRAGSDFELIDTKTGKRKEGRRIRFTGTADSPFMYVPLIDVWQGAIIQDPTYRVLLVNGTKVKWTKVIGNAKKEIVGEIRDWKFIPILLSAQ